ncbi:MAG: MBL fold metallo-hydrolase [Cyanobacteria bacterium J06598_3]
MKLTWLDANSWLIEAAGQRILVDPWLVGDLVFGNLTWLVRGVRPVPIEIPQNIDLILLSQGLADHAHPETLKALDKSIPVVASADGAAIAQKFGYESVTTLAHGETHVQNGLEIKAFIGAVVGPAKRENGYVLSFLSEGKRLYYEPHGYPDVAHLREFVASAGPVDVVITPMADITLMGVAPVVRGGDVAVEIARVLKPQVMLPTAEAGKVTYEGLLASALKLAGGAAALRSRIADEGEGTRVIQPVSGEIIALDLSQPAVAG